MRTLDIETLKSTEADFNTPSKFIHSLAYSPDGNLSACGNIDGVVQIFDMRLREEKIRLENHGMAVRALKF
jgi:WD40 repeat protein